MCPLRPSTAWQIREPGSTSGLREGSPLCQADNLPLTLPCFAIAESMGASAHGQERLVDPANLQHGDGGPRLFCLGSPNTACTEPRDSARARAAGRNPRGGTCVHARALIDPADLRHSDDSYGLRLRVTVLPDHHRAAGLSGSLCPSTGRSASSTRPTSHTATAAMA